MAHYFIGEPNAMELAWAAGFFDGEGTCVAYLGKRKGRTGPERLRPRMSITQHGMEAIPEVLARFHRAVGRLGRISGPHAVGYATSRWLTRWTWSTTKNAEVRMIFELLDPYLSSIKREQVGAALQRYELDHLSTRTYTVRPLRLDFS